MSIILTEVGRETKTAKAYFGPDDAPGEPLTFSYDPSKYTPLLEQAVASAYDNNRIGTMYAAMLDGVVKEWDAKDVHPEDKEKIRSGELTPDKARLVDFPPTSENIARTPIGALVKIVQAMQSDQRPSPEVSENSSGSFGI